MTSRRDVGPKAKALYRNARDKFSALLERDPTTLTPADFQEWIGANSNLSPRTLAHYLSTVRQVLDFADVVPNPARSPKVKLPTESRARSRSRTARSGRRSSGTPSTASWSHSDSLRRTACASPRPQTSPTGTSTSLTDEFASHGRRRSGGRPVSAGYPSPVELLDEMAALCPLEDRTERAARLPESAMTPSARGSSSPAGTPGSPTPARRPSPSPCVPVGRPEILRPDHGQGVVRTQSPRPR